jgi:hypothetical protein
MSRQDDLEQRLAQAVARVAADFADLGDGLRWALARGLIHRAVHHAFDGGAGGGTVEFCALATYLGEMVGHAHKLAHGDNPRAPGHSDFVH